MNDKLKLSFGLVMFVVFLAMTAVIVSVKDARNDIEATKTELIKQYRNPVVIRDTVKITVEVPVVKYDTIRKYIEAVSYSGGIAYSPQVHTDAVVADDKDEEIIMEFPNDYTMHFDPKSYRILCNGSLYEKIDEDGDSWRECAGEWIISIKEKRD
jgi:predicted Holliday junction resolvase-like endonuclease